MVKILPGLGRLNKISIKELPKRFEGLNSHKGLRTKVGQLRTSTSVKGTVFHISMVYNPSNYIIVREDDRTCNNHMKARISNSLINELITLEV